MRPAGMLLQSARMRTGIWVFAVVLSLSIGVAAAGLHYVLSAPSFSVVHDVRILLLVLAWVCTALALGLPLACAWYAYRLGHYALYQNVMVWRRGRREHSYALGEIEDVTLVSGGAAFRQNAQSGWQHISVNHANFRGFVDAFMKAHEAHRAPPLLAALQAGQSVRFSRFDGFSLSVFLFGGMRPTRADVLLSPGSLHIGETRIPLHCIADIRDNDWTSQTAFVDHQGRSLFRFESGSLLNQHLLLGLIASLQRTPAFAHADAQAERVVEPVQADRGGFLGTVLRGAGILLAILSGSAVVAGVKAGAISGMAHALYSHPTSTPAPLVPIVPSRGTQ